jgi:hypothetical protein
LRSEGDLESRGHNFPDLDSINFRGPPSNLHHGNARRRSLPRAEDEPRIAAALATASPCVALRRRAFERMRLTSTAARDARSSPRGVHPAAGQESVRYAICASSRRALRQGERFEAAPGGRARESIREIEGAVSQRVSPPARAESSRASKVVTSCVLRRRPAAGCGGARDTVSRCGVQAVRAESPAAPKVNPLCG